MTTRAALRVAPTSSTARNTNALSLSGSRAGAGWTADMGDLRGSVSAEAEHPAAGRRSHQGAHLVMIAPCCWAATPSSVGSIASSPTHGRARAASSPSSGRWASARPALLDAVTGRAGGMRVLRARGVESEAAVPFAGLLELLRPALGELARIPRPQAAALGGALALRPGSGGDRFAGGAATLSLLAAQAEIAPTLVLVDDAHWLDDSSADALRFALRRLLADPIAVVLAVRAGEPSLLDGSDLPVLMLAGLDGAAAGALLARRGTTPAVDVLHAATAGNPLALLELAARSDDVAAVGPAPLPERLAEAFGGRVDSLPAPTRAALLVAAAGDDGALAVLARAGAPAEALALAEAAGLVRLGAGRVEFHHPLVRSAVYARAAPTDLRAAHRALAAALPDRDADRRAWHLAAAAVGPDERAAAALEQAGGRARAPRGHRGGA